MIFPKPLDRAVLEQRKTTQRVPVRYTDGCFKPCPFRPGRDYTVQRTLGGPELARVEVLDVTRRRLGDITHDEIRREGHRTRVAFADAWMCQHDRDWPKVIGCADCKGSGEHVVDADGFNVDTAPCLSCKGDGVLPVETTDQDVLDRFETRHAHELVWVIAFQLLDAPRLLAARPPADYTSRRHDAVPDEPEAIDERTLEQFTLEARRRHQARRRGDLDDVFAQARSLDERIRVLTDLARDRGVDVRDDLRVIGFRGATHPASIRRLQAMERKLRDQLRAA